MFLDIFIKTESTFPPTLQEAKTSLSKKKKNRASRFGAELHVLASSAILLVNSEAPLEKNFLVSSHKLMDLRENG